MGAKYGIRIYILPARGKYGPMARQAGLLGVKMPHRPFAGGLQPDHRLSRLLA
jgi:hypothetical protein